MDPALHDELDYELKIRGVNVAKSNTVQAQNKCLAMEVARRTFSRGIVHGASRKRASGQKDGSRSAPSNELASSRSVN
jgi:hypothetical protein